MERRVGIGTLMARPLWGRPATVEDTLTVRMAAYSVPRRLLKCSLDGALRPTAIVFAFIVNHIRSVDGDGHEDKRITIITVPWLPIPSKEKGIGAIPYPAGSPGETSYDGTMAVVFQGVFCVAAAPEHALVAGRASPLESPLGGPAVPDSREASCRHAWRYRPAEGK
jgi:hypothetical protein